MRSLVLLTALFVLVPAGPCFAAGDWGWPVRGQVLTGFRNGDDPYAAGQHRGVDIGAPVGTPVTAAVSGTVEFAGVVGSSGLVVSERTADGRYQLSYLHLASTAVKRGDSVGRGDRLGAAGVSGTRSVDAPHLHFGVREAADRDGYLDPLDFLAPLPPADAPEPRAVPVPVSEPVAASPAPAPAAPPALAPAQVATVPVGLPAPAQARARTPHVSGAPAPAPAGQRGVPAAVNPSRVPAPSRAAGSAHDRATQHAVRPGSGPDAATGTSARPRAQAAPATPRGRGIDVGWLAACLGLVVVATLLAAPSRRDWNFRALIRALARPERRTPPVAFDRRWPTTSQPRSTT